ncbi:MAG: PAS domain-containing protein [Myxococcota bacterium]|nr:PAS domain-containing protein [Myxococcota bacterium]
MSLEEQVARLEAELAELRESEVEGRAIRARAEALIDHLPYMAWMKSTDGVFLEVNERFAIAAGRSREWILGRTDRDLWPPAHAAGYVADDLRVIASGEKVFVEEPIAEQSGTKWFETFKTPVFDAEGRVVATVGLARDITERKRVEAQQRALESRIQQAQKLESLGLLAGGVAHDFNNLLVGVLSNAELALRQLQQVPGAERAIERMQDVRLAALRAAELTNQMLAYSGRGNFVVRPISLNDVVRELPQLLQASISKKAQLQLALTPLAPVQADVTQIRQVLMNLITNASDALGDREGTIRVETGMEKLTTTGHVDAGGAAELAPGRYVFLQVSDDGCGMAEETRARLFEPFYSTKLTGRGLGLSAVQGIVRGHRGGLMVQSVPGRGTTIRVLLPTTDVPAEDLSPDPESAASDWRGSGLVLLVDDDDRVRLTTKLILEELGFEVHASPNGRSAIQQFERDGERVRIVVLDMSMPDLSGAEVFEALRAIRPDVRVLLCSGYDEHDTRQRLQRSAIAGFLQKPYSLDALTRKLRAALQE